MKKIMFSVFFGVSVLVSAAQGTWHVVKKGETLYGIAKNYGISFADLKSSNPVLLSNPNVKVGQKLSIPGTKLNTSSTGTKTVAAKVHTITKGETLYAVCKKYGVSITEIKAWNKLSDLNVKPGQRLIVSKVNEMAIYKPIAVPSTPDTPYREEDARPRVNIPEVKKSEAAIVQEKIITEKPKEIIETSKPAPVITSLKTSSSEPSEYPGIFNQYSAHGFKIKRNRGAANYLADATSGNQHLAFYNDAETGSIIRVTNMMNHKTIFVKVIGKLPPADAANEIVIKLANKAARDLGVQDDKFLAEIASYSGN